MRKCLPALLCAMLFFSFSAFADEMSPGKMKAFADSLFEQGDYYRAITEYERLLFYYPGNEFAKTARFQIALCYFKGEKLEQAISQFRAIAKDFADQEIGRKALFMDGEAYYRKQDYLRAVDVYAGFIEAYPSDPQADAARLKIGWAYLRQGYWRHAQEEFEKVPAGSPLRKQAEGLSGGALSYEDIPRKSPALAGGLSAVLPGAGQLYVGRPGDATASFLLNGAFIWATVEAFHKGNNATGAVLLFFESGWYLGNIYSAVSSAHKYNRRSEQQFLEELQSRYDIGLSRDADGRNIAMFRIRF